LFAKDWATAPQLAEQAVAQRRIEVGQYLAAQAQAKAQQDLADYLASLPPPTTAPSAQATDPGPTASPQAPIQNSCATGNRALCVAAGPVGSSCAGMQLGSIGRAPDNTLVQCSQYGPGNQVWLAS